MIYEMLTGKNPVKDGIKKNKAEMEKREMANPQVRFDVATDFVKV